MTQSLKIIIGTAAICAVAAIAFIAPKYLEVRDCRAAAIEFQGLRVRTEALAASHLNIAAIQGYAEMKAMREQMKNYCKGANYHDAVLGNVEAIRMRTY